MKPENCLCLTCLLSRSTFQQTYFTPFSTVSIVDFEQVIFRNDVLNGWHFKSLPYNQFCKNVNHEHAKHILLYFPRSYFPADINLLKVNSGSDTRMCEIYSKLIIKTPERRQWRALVFLRKQQIWSHLLKKFLMEKIFCFFWSVILLSILVCLSIWTMSKFEVWMIERILGYAYVIKCRLKLNILFISFKSSQANTRVFLPRSRSNWLPKFFNPILQFLMKHFFMK